MSEKKKLNATQRIEALENLVSQQHGVVEAQSNNIKFLAQEIDGLKQTIQALARRLNASIQAGDSNDQVQQILVEENVKELEGKVTFLMEQGVLEDAKSDKVHERSFIIARELDEDKNEVNPRMQFAIASLTPEAKEKIQDKKLGDLVQDFSGDGLVLEITKLYDIAEPKAQEKQLEEVKEEASEEEKEG